jgi:hypothetical protein
MQQYDTLPVILCTFYKTISLTTYIENGLIVVPPVPENKKTKSLKQPGCQSMNNHDLRPVALRPRLSCGFAFY